MNEMIKKEVIERISFFYKLKTYTYIKNSFNRFFNGTITDISNKEYILFLDDELGVIPIKINEIVVIDYSNKVKHG